jgi:hypothetical protein
MKSIAQIASYRTTANSSSSVEPSSSSSPLSFRSSSSKSTLHFDHLTHPSSPNSLPVDLPTLSFIPSQSHATPESMADYNLRDHCLRTASLIHDGSSNRPEVHLDDNGLPDSCELLLSSLITGESSDDDWPFVVRPNELLVERILNDEHEFNRQLYRLMRSIGKPIQRVPHLGFKRLNLYEFFRIAARLGGYTWITRNRDWKRVYDSISDDRKSTSAATCTRRHYEALLLPFERYVQRLRGNNQPPIRQVTRLQRGRKPKMLSERSEQIERLMRAELNMRDKAQDPFLQVEQPLSEVQNLSTNADLGESPPEVAVKSTEPIECEWNAGRAILNTLLSVDQWKTDGSEPNLLLPRKRGRRPKYIKELQEQLGRNLDLVLPTRTATEAEFMRGRVHSIGSTLDVCKRLETTAQNAAFHSTRHWRADTSADHPNHGAKIEEDMRKRSRSLGAWAYVRPSIAHKIIGQADSRASESTSTFDSKSDQLALDLRMKSKEDKKQNQNVDKCISDTEPEATRVMQQALNEYLLQFYCIALKGQSGG